MEVSSLHYEPFIYQENGKYKGIEYKLLETIAKKEHLDVSFRFHERNDISIGGFFPNPTNSTEYIFSKPYYQDDLTWCIQKSKNFPMVINVFLAATPECWILLIFGIGYVSGLLIYIMIQFDFKYENRNQRDWHYTTWLVALPAVIGLNQRFHPKSMSIRIFYGFILIMMIFLWQIVFYFGIRFVKVPIQRQQVSTTAELIDSEYRLAGSHELIDLIKFDERYRKSQIDSFFVCPNIDHCLDHLKHDDNELLAIGGSRQRILNSQSYSPAGIFCFDRESIASFQPAMLMRKDFALKRKIDEIIRNAFESGLFVKWDRDSQRKKERVIPFEPSVVLSVENIAMPLVFAIGVGSLMATAAFYCEILISRKIKENAPSRHWVYLEQFFDGERHYLKNMTEKLQITEYEALIDYGLSSLVVDFL
ncbi:uncharacterized protein LOC129572917 [Sitodiplosis mosellana]|uniref:uncharacterized protein LOC129572917 n=1 Tax=Sitodiplosis mosellana TaxID=263140 RepID=UPI002444F8C1|nr:uncharacterized protein LOC129572917 [Sitodiplosis mosellana]